MLETIEEEEKGREKKAKPPAPKVGAGGSEKIFEGKRGVLNWSLSEALEVIKGEKDV